MNKQTKERLKTMLFFSDPDKCFRCQNKGFMDNLVNGNCHRCNVRNILSACITSNVRAGNTALAIKQLRMIGF